MSFLTKMLQLVLCSVFLFSILLSKPFQHEPLKIVTSSITPWFPRAERSVSPFLQNLRHRLHAPLPTHYLCDPQHPSLLPNCSIIISPCTRDPLVQSSHLQLPIRCFFFHGVLVYPVPASRVKEVSAALLCFNELHRACFIVKYIVPCIRNGSASIGGYVFPCYLIRLFDIFRDFSYLQPVFPFFFKFLG